MPKEESFFLSQYQSLREEIKEAKARKFKILSFGLVIVPTTALLADKWEIWMLNLTLPFAVAIAVLVYISESRSIMRCGEFIRDNIEAKVEGVAGWEKWLCDSESQGSRKSDKFTFYGFFILSFSYYLASCFIAWMSIGKEGLEFLKPFAVGVYLAVFVGIAIGLVRNYAKATSTTARKQNKK